MNIPDPNVLIFAGIAFIRIAGILFILPIFGDAPTPIQSRILIAIAVTFCIYPTISSMWEKNQIPEDIIVFLILILKELCIGISIGFVARMGFDAILGAAGIVSSQMGFASARLFMPDLKSEIDGFTALHRMIVMVIFLGLNLHVLFFKAILESFHYIPLGSANPSKNVLQSVIQMSTNVLSIAIELGSPVLIALLFTTTALGLMARSVPQLNAFTLSFPISFFVGILVYIASIPLFPEWVESYWSGVHKQILTIILLLKP